MLLEEGVPSLVRRSGGFDVPDFLAAGPRDVLVPESGAAAARDVLRTARRTSARGRTTCPSRAPAWVRALAVALAVLIVALVAAGAVQRRAELSQRRRREVIPPGSASRARCDRQASSVRRTPRPPKPCSSSGPRAVARAGHRRPLALLARQQVEHGPAEQQRVAVAGREARAPSPRAAAA